MLRPVPPWRSKDRLGNVLATFVFLRLPLNQLSFMLFWPSTFDFFAHAPDALWKGTVSEAGYLTDQPSIPAEPKLSMGDRLAAEGSLLASLPSEIGGGVLNRLTFDAHHKISTALEIATGFVFAAGLTVATRNPGLVGRLASYAPALFLGATAFDLGRRFAGPMLDTWTHPADLERNKQWLGDNVGSALVDYPLVALSGFAGDKFAGMLSSGSDTLPFSLGSDKSLNEKVQPNWSAHGKLLGRHLLDAPVVIGANLIEQKLFPTGEFPNFPKTLNPTPPKSYSELKPGASVSVVPETGLQLNSGADTSTIGIHMDQRGPARLDITAAGPGTSWEKENDTSAVLSLYVDGKYDQDVVLWGGSQNTPYALSLGDLAAGNHEITFRYAQEKSAPGASGVDVQSGKATAITYPDQTAKWVDEYAPVMYGLNGLESNSMQTPLGMWDSVDHKSDGSASITYGYFFSNENGGDGFQPAIEQAEWGRMTDIQTVMNVQVNKNGLIDKISYIGAADKWFPFKGNYQGTHPIIMDDTQNDDVIDSGSGPLLFKMPSDYTLAPGEPEAEIMNQNPEWWRIMYEEIAREGKVDHGGNGDIPVQSIPGVAMDWLRVNLLGDVNQMADPRRYLYVQYHGNNVPVAAEVTLRDGKHYFSDFGVSGVAIGYSGWNQTAVLLPKGTRTDDITNVHFVSRGQGGQVSQIGRIFELDQNFNAVEVNADHQPD